MRRTELLLPARTLLAVLAVIGIAVAFRAIGDTFLIVFIGIFLALVFEYPVRFVMAKTRMSRGLAATVTVLGTAVAVFLLMLLLLVPLVGRARLPPGPAADGPEPPRLRRVLLARRLGRGRERPGWRAAGLRLGPRRDLGRARHRRQLLRCLPRQLHDPLHLSLPAQRHREPEALARERAHAGRGRSLARRVGAGHDLDLALGDRRRRHRHDRRHHPGN